MKPPKLTGTAGWDFVLWVFVVAVLGGCTVGFVWTIRDELRCSESSCPRGAAPVLVREACVCLEAAKEAP